MGAERTAVDAALARAAQFDRERDALLAAHPDIAARLVPAYTLSLIHISAAGMTALRIFCMGNILLWYFLFYSPTGRGKHEPRLPPPQNERRIHSSIFDTPCCRCHPGLAGKGGK